MAMNSVTSTSGAVVALQMINVAVERARTEQQRVFTELSAPRDDDARSGARIDVSAPTTASDTNQKSQSVLDAAISTGTTLSGLLTQMQAKAQAAASDTLDDKGRAALSSDFVALRDQVTSMIANAGFGGSTLLAAADGSVITFSADATFSNAPAASKIAGQLKTSVANVAATLDKLDSGSKALKTAELRDARSSGLGALVKEGMAKESATQQALATRQQLGGQPLSIANSAPTALLSLLR